MRVAVPLLAVFAILRVTSAGETKQGNADVDRYKALILERNKTPEISATKKDKSSQKQWGTFNNVEKNSQSGIIDSSATEGNKSSKKRWGGTNFGEETNKVLSNIGDGLNSFGRGFEKGSRPGYLGSEENKSSQNQQSSNYDAAALLGGSKFPDIPASEQERSAEKKLGAYADNGGGSIAGGSLEGSTRPWYSSKLSQEQLNPNTYSAPASTNNNDYLNAGANYPGSKLDSEFERHDALLGGSKFPDIPASEQERSAEKKLGAYADNGGGSIAGGSLEGSTRPWYSSKLSQEQLNPNTYSAPASNNNIDNLNAEIARIEALLRDNFAPEEGISPENKWGAYSYSGEGKVDDGLYSIGGNRDRNARPHWSSSSEEKNPSKEHLNPTKINDIDAEIERIQALLGLGKSPQYLSSEHETSHDAFTTEPTYVGMRSIDSKSMHSGENSGGKEVPWYQNQKPGDHPLDQLNMNVQSHDSYTTVQPEVASDNSLQREFSFQHWIKADNSRERQTTYVQSSENDLDGMIQSGQKPYQSQGLPSPLEPSSAQRDHPTQPAQNKQQPHNTMSNEVDRILEMESPKPPPQEKKNKPFWKRLLCIP